MKDYYSELKAHAKEWDLESLDKKIDSLKDDPIGIQRLYNDTKKSSKWGKKNLIQKESKMKRSELAEFIKEEIRSVLNEESPEDAKKYADEMERAAAASDKIKANLGEEMDDDEADKAASAGAKKEPLGKLATKMAQNQKEMKSVLAKYKKAEGTEKEKHLARLKDLTKIKKELEKLLQ